MRRNEQWFLDRIGKKVFRDINDCPCDTCKDIGAHGLTIVDRLHALYLYDIQCNYEAEGTSLNYRDER